MENIFQWDEKPKKMCSKSAFVAYSSDHFHIFYYSIQSRIIDPTRVLDECSIGQEYNLADHGVATGYKARYQEVVRVFPSTGFCETEH